MADKAAMEWTYLLPGVIYQPFAVNNLTDSDYFDDLHFSNALVYNKWNSELRRALQHTKYPNRPYFFGAVRTLINTHKSIFDNWIWPLCAPPTCIAHVVTHFSYKDNRPNDLNNDPKGLSVTTDLGVESVNTMFEGIDWHGYNDFIRCYRVHMIFA